MVSIKEYAEEGWKAKIKTVKGHKYIVLRLRGKDKSLGPYTEELWNKCIQLEMTRREPENIDALKKTVEKLTQQVNDVVLKLEEKSVLLKKLRKKNAKDHQSILSFQKTLTDLQRNIPLTNLYDDFKCSGCGSQRLIAVNIRCTKCNIESWWGWQPKK